MANQSVSVSSGVSTKLFKLALLILVSCLFIRICSLGLYPLMDTTEARYGEMARIMAESNDWITPMFDYGVPFWGKPPMFTWLSGLGFEVFGVNEFAARLPHLLVGCLTLWVVWIFARSHLTASSGLATHLSRNEQSGQRLAWLAVAIWRLRHRLLLFRGL
jgi:4-amino-4-deoxy-L-arabinose transferase-like glycosyltransferase